MKLSLEHRLTEMNTFYKEMIKKGINMNVEKQKDMVALESKMISMYLNDQNVVMIQLASNINILQAQILGTYNTRSVSGLLVSDQSVSPSKYVQLFLVIIAAFFFAFFGVFVVNFADKLMRNNN